MANSILEAFSEGQDPNRPRILMVGDSIVGGYYGATRNLFAGKAIVYAGGTTYNDAQPNWYLPRPHRFPNERRERSSMRI